MAAATAQVHDMQRSLAEEQRHSAELRAELQRRAGAAEVLAAALREAQVGAGASTLVQEATDFAGRSSVKALHITADACCLECCLDNAPPMQGSGREVRGAWRRTEAALAEAIRARRSTEQSKLELVEALIAERAGRIALAQQVCTWAAGEQVSTGVQVSNTRSGVDGEPEMRWGDSRLP